MTQGATVHRAGAASPRTFCFGRCAWMQVDQQQVVHGRMASWYHTMYVSKCMSRCNKSICLESAERTCGLSSNAWSVLKHRSWAERVFGSCATMATCMDSML